MVCLKIILALVHFSHRVPKIQLNGMKLIYKHLIQELPRSCFTFT